MKTLTLTFLTILFSLNVLNAQDWGNEFRFVEEGQDGDDYFGCSVSVSGNTAVIGARNDSDGLSRILRQGSAIVFTKQENGEWVQQQKLVASYPWGDNRFGTSVSIDDDYIIVGAPRNAYDENEVNYYQSSGAAYIYKLVGDQWEFQQKLVAPDRWPNDLFGWAVSIDNDVAIVGAFGQKKDENGENMISKAGAVYIYERQEDNTWAFYQKIVASNRYYNTMFGYSLDITGNMIIVGAPNHPHDQNGNLFMEEAGGAYIFEKFDGVWEERSILVHPERQPGDWYGYTVSCSNNYGVVGAPYDDVNYNSEELDYAGSAFVYSKNIDNQWELSTQLFPDDYTNGDLFGVSVAAYDRYIAAGSRDEVLGLPGSEPVDDAGSVFVFGKSGDQWIQLQKLAAENREINDWYGYSVAMEGMHIVVGANQKNSLDPPWLGDYAGAAFVYESHNISTPELFVEESFSYFPNPTNGPVAIEFIDVQPQVIIIARNIFGTEVRRYEFNNALNVTIDLPNNRGLYFVEINSENKTSVIKVIVN